MSVKAQLEQAKADFAAKVPVEAQAEILRHVQELQQTGIVFGLKAGDKAPNFTLADPFGEQVTLYDELVHGPVVLIFYRGSWCPFCNIQLRGWQQTLPEIRKRGARLIAVSPQSPDHALFQKEKEELAFPVLSDPLFELPEYLRNTYQNVLHRDLAVFNRTGRWILPVPATYIIDKEERVRFAHADPDFMKRAEPREIVRQLEKL
jgi:peroxiredoxin